MNISFSTICPKNAEEFLRSSKYSFLSEEKKKYILENLGQELRVQDPSFYETPVIEASGIHRRFVYSQDKQLAEKFLQSEKYKYLTEKMKEYVINNLYDITVDNPEKIEKPLLRIHENGAFHQENIYNADKTLEEIKETKRVKLSLTRYDLMRELEKLLPSKKSHNLYKISLTAYKRLYLSSKDSIGMEKTLAKFKKTASTRPDQGGPLARSFEEKMDQILKITKAMESL